METIIFTVNLQERPLPRYIKKTVSMKDNRLIAFYRK